MKKIDIAALSGMILFFLGVGSYDGQPVICGVMALIGIGIVYLVYRKGGRRQLDELNFLKELKEFHIGRIQSFQKEIEKSERCLEVLERIIKIIKGQEQQKLPF